MKQTEFNCKEFDDFIEKVEKAEKKIAMKKEKREKRKVAFRGIMEAACDVMTSMSGTLIAFMVIAKLQNKG